MILCAVEVEVEVTDQGDGPAPASALNLYYSEDAFLSSPDPLLGTEAVGPLGPGDHHTFTFNVTLPLGATPGLHYFISKSAVVMKAIRARLI
jgi:hypothetical protein